MNRRSILPSSLRFRVRWPWQAAGRHYKLMLTTSMISVVLILILWGIHQYAAAAGVFLWLLTLAVQWLCIEPPDVTDEDLH